MASAVAEIFVGTRTWYSNGEPIGGEELCCAVRVNDKQVMNDKNFVYISCAPQFGAKWMSFVAVMRQAKVYKFVLLNGKRLRQSTKDVVDCVKLPTYMVGELGKFLALNGFEEVGE
jgi:hypothetical protein